MKMTRAEAIRYAGTFPAQNDTSGWLYKDWAQAVLDGDDADAARYAARAEAMEAGGPKMSKPIAIKSNFGQVLYLEYINGMGEAIFSEKVISQWQKRISVNAKLLAALKLGKPVCVTTMTGVGPETMIWQVVEDQS